jgi:hypothetical protein
MKENFKTIKFVKTTRVVVEGAEISCYIAGVNSGMYGFPFIVSINVWTKKWFWKKFFQKKIELNYWEVKQLHEELGKVLNHFNNTMPTEI